MNETEIRKQIAHLEAEITRLKAMLPKKKARNDGYSADFLVFWGVYPRWVGKKVAWKQWLARTKEGTPAKSLIQSAQNYAKSRKGEDPKYTMQPATFLGPNERWKDWVGGNRPDRGERVKTPEEVAEDEKREQVKERLVDLGYGRLV